MNATNFNLASDKDCRRFQKSLGRRLNREDFPADATGWTNYCEYRIRMSTRALRRDQRNLDYWTKVKQGEHLAAATEKVNALQDALAEIEKLKAQIAAGKK